MSDLPTAFAQMKERFDPEAADDLDAVFQYDIDGEHWYVTITDGEQCEVNQGQADEPDLTLTLSKTVFLNIMSGETDGMQAFMAGDVQADGNMMLAPQLETLFPAN